MLRLIICARMHNRRVMAFALDTSAKRLLLAVLSWNIQSLHVITVDLCFPLAFILC